MTQEISRRLIGGEWVTGAQAEGGALEPVDPVREQLDGNGHTVADGGQEALTWDTSNGPDVLLDRSALTLPEVIAAGIYAVSVSISTDGMTAGGNYRVLLVLDSAGDDVTFYADSALATADNPAPRVTVGGVRFLPAAAQIRVVVENYDGTQDVIFSLSSAVVQLIPGVLEAGGDLPPEWTVTDGSLEIEANPQSRIRLRTDANPNHTIDMSVDDIGGGSYNATLNIEAGGGGAAQVYITEEPTAGASVFIDGRGSLELFTIPGRKALTAWDADGNVLRFALLPAGQIATGVVAAPADGDIAASQLALWFDDTNGAAKLMLKGKTADGTVVEGEVALT